MFTTSTAFQTGNLYRLINRVSYAANRIVPVDLPGVPRGVTTLTPSSRYCSTDRVTRGTQYAKPPPVSRGTPRRDDTSRSGPRSMMTAEDSLSTEDRPSRAEGLRRGATDRTMSIVPRETPKRLNVAREGVGRCCRTQYEPNQCDRRFTGLEPLRVRQEPIASGYSTRTTHWGFFCNNAPPSGAPNQHARRPIEAPTTTAAWDHVLPPMTDLQRPMAKRTSPISKLLDLEAERGH